ncbi:MAG TPA: glycosyl transferase [Microscillaceae bacterium]|nr:glycosyl transferase [Microscillaceae bacterium]
MIILFWLSVGLLLYTYLGYGAVMAMLVKLKTRLRGKTAVKLMEDFPSVSLVIPAYNEENYIREKIINSLGLHYPAKKLDIIVVTDGSNDLTPDIVRQYPEVRLLHKASRKGKIHAMHRTMKCIHSDIVVFSDANTTLNPGALLHLVKHYQDPKVGAVAGEKRIKLKAEESANGAGEGIYWRYESWLKRMDSAFHSVVGAAGELFSLRTNLYEEVPNNAILDDFMLSMRVAQKGYLVKYEPEAQAWETPSSSVKEEFKRKIRICAGGIQSILWLLPLLNIFRYGWLSFQYVSHRVLRWTLAPLALVLAFVANGWLAFTSSPLFALLWGLQISFYVLALGGWRVRNRSFKIKGLFVPYYFVVMNLSVFLGLWRYLKGQQSVVWEKAQRRA